ncbi:MAG TPA: alpha-glucan family phosphorylase [Symbiobacteriaceae bacterium]|nr:alpha-glucan family phosphorylase [Symbiobacteriaceae bacterium]
MDPKIVYFSMEYGLSEEMHAYAGGLGILAGDYLKGAADLGMPLVGIGILWRHGYTTQLVGDSGWPYDRYPDFRYDFLEDTGVRISVHIQDRPVVVKVWKTTHFGNAPLFLLDTNISENAHADRDITAHLYGGGREERIAQEIVLGIGGIRAITTLGIRPEIYHFNEGHAVLAATELIRRLMEQGRSFQEAWNEVRQSVVFTTHTPVPEGNEWHPLDALLKMGANNGLSMEQMAAIGDDPFNMTVAGLRLSRIANAVSELHGHTARKMWSHVRGTAPIIHVTNGVHPATWQNPAVAAAATDDELWKAHRDAKRTLLSEIYGRTGTWMDPDTLLIGYARRAAAYKRTGLIFRDPARVEPFIESNRLNLVFAGKAHPRDDNGKAVIAKLVERSRQYQGHVVFLQNYDMKVGRLLTQGCDVWLNNPRRPLEASGTSGMKAAMNGVLHLSTPDGWWPEAVQHGENGWAFGGGEIGDVDAYDAEQLYDVLTNQVIPTYYNDRPTWVRMMRASIETTREAYSVHRMIRQYEQLIYRQMAPV